MRLFFSLNNQVFNRISRGLYTFRSLFFGETNFFQTARLYVSFRRFARAWSRSHDFQLKIDEVLKSPDNQRIPRHSKAGSVDHDILTMHNGIQIYAESYEGRGMAKLLQANRGVHEPQEEYCFAVVLDWIKASSNPEPAMIELGSNWAFYSLWFLSQFPDAKCLLVEPNQTNLEAGRRNFQLNHRQGKFISSLVGTSPTGSSVPSISFSRLLSMLPSQSCSILHADIQGHELELLEEARPFLLGGKIDFLFISSHSNYLHYRCLDLLRDCGLQVLAEASLLETFSTDGIIVAGVRARCRQNSIPITKRSATKLSF